MTVNFNELKEQDIRGMNGGNGTLSAKMLADKNGKLIACTLLSENFLIFSAVCLIASLAFAFSCGFPARTIVRKFAVFIVAALCCYVAVHILTDYNGCRESLYNISEALVQFGKNTASFFSALWLPIP